MFWVVKISIYNQLIQSIINQIKTIVGPVAVTQANQVKGLTTNHKVVIKGNPQNIIKNLISKYKLIMGPVALTLAKKGAVSILKKNPELKVPSELR